MSKLVTKQNNRSFKETFDYVESYTMDNLKLSESFDS